MVLLLQCCCNIVLVPVVFLFLWSCCGLATILLWAYCAPVVPGCCHAVNLLRACCCGPVVVPNVGQMWSGCSPFVFLLWFLSVSLRCEVVRAVVSLWSGCFCCCRAEALFWFLSYPCCCLVAIWVRSCCGLLVVLLWSCRCGPVAVLVWIM